MTINVLTITILLLSFMYIFPSPLFSPLCMYLHPHPSNLRYGCLLMAWPVFSWYWVIEYYLDELISLTKVDEQYAHQNHIMTFPFFFCPVTTTLPNIRIYNPPHLLWLITNGVDYFWWCWVINYYCILIVLIDKIWW